MRQYYLIEDKLPPKLPVIFSPKISKRIETIYNKNQDNCIDIHFNLWGQIVRNCQAKNGITVLFFFATFFLKKCPTIHESS